MSRRMPRISISANELLNYIDATPRLYMARDEIFVRLGRYPRRRHVKSLVLFTRHAARNYHQKTKQWGMWKRACTPHTAKLVAEELLRQFWQWWEGMTPLERYRSTTTAAEVLEESRRPRRVVRPPPEASGTPGPTADEPTADEPTADEPT